MDFSSHFTRNYQNFNTESNGNDLGNKAHAKRKCLAQLYNASLNCDLDNQSICHLLKNNLDSYRNLIEENGEHIYNERIKTILNRKNINVCNLKSNLQKIDIKSLIKPVSCSITDSFTCTKSEKIGNYEFSQFLDSYKQQPKNTLNSQKIDKKPLFPYFKTANEELQQENAKKNTNPIQYGSSSKRKLGVRRNVNSKFVSPLLVNEENSQKCEEFQEEEIADERLKNIEPKMVEMIKSEIMDSGINYEWDDIAGLDFAKMVIKEAVVWPMLRPDIFTGLRQPPKGILLFGPPGTGKTLIGKCVASQSKSTFFSISASSLTSKWVGDGEKMVRALFTVARCYQPSVIFIDEIDSLLSQRSEQEHECSRRIKTEFLIQLDGATINNNEKLLLIGATNRPQELDEAARRRFVKRLYIPLPELKGRLQLLKKLIENEKHTLKCEEFQEIAQLSNGYSGADLKNLCSEASLGPIRAMDFGLIEKIQVSQVRPLNMDDFKMAFTRIKSSVSPKDLGVYEEWDKTYGSGL